MGAHLPKAASPELGLHNVGLDPLTPLRDSPPVISLLLMGYEARKLVPQHISTPPTLLNLAFSWSLAVEDLFYQSSGHFQSELHYM